MTEIFDWSVKNQIKQKKKKHELTVYNRLKCRKYETGFILFCTFLNFALHSFIILYIFAQASYFVLYAQVSYFVHFHRFHIFYIFTGFIFCTFSQVSYFVHFQGFHILYILRISYFVHFHRFHILYIFTGFIFCTFSQVSYFVHFHRFHILYIFCNCDSKVEQLHVSQDVSILTCWQLISEVMYKFIYFSTVF